jgi:tocopherol cyclase
VANVIRRLYGPELFQGEHHLRRAHRGFFEGWYFKFASEAGAWAFIPGVSLAGEDSHSFVQINGPSGSAYHRFGLDEFRFSSHPFGIAVGPNRFSLDEVHVDVPELRADLTLSGHTKWPSTLASPSSMGWYAFARFMECYHGIIVLNGKARGKVGAVEAQDWRFYLEKDWGRSFPKAWIWAQSNSFAEEACFTCSVAVVPFRSFAFAGFIIGLLAKGRLYRFATYNRAQLDAVEVGAHEVRLEVRRGGLRLQATAFRTEGAELASPVDGVMEGRIREAVDARVTVRLEEEGLELFSGTGTQTGLEVVHPELLRSYLG